MGTHEIVAASAEASAVTVGTRTFHTLTKNALRMVGAEVANHVDATDKPGFFAPAELEVDGKDRLGGLLVLADRVIIAWTIGVFRMKNFEAVVPLDTPVRCTAV